MSDTTMKIVRINKNPSACDEDGGLRPGVKSFDAIINNIDTAEGRTAALKAYIYALRDLQVAYNNDAAGYDEAGSQEDRDKAIDVAQAAVREAFDRLVFCEYSLNRFPTNLATA